MLLLVDLDNTLIDRTGAFVAWARERFGEAEVAWLTEQDRDGYRKREELAEAIAARYRLDAREALVELRAGMVEHLAPDHAAYDIGGGAAAGLRTGWVSAGRSWPDDLPYRPTVTGADCVSTLRALTAA
ncbi:hypothetical protein [Paractinoplanes maris]|uniref:hypothetical protein n=1 Tax=Paractinoplanes maris TaxID=1734446 RepID=UPI002021BFC8|nr:hypothetical protein [Actinoplanes maris]